MCGPSTPKEPEEEPPFKIREPHRTADDVFGDESLDWEDVNLGTEERADVQTNFDDREDGVPMIRHYSGMIWTDGEVKKYRPATQPIDLIHDMNLDYDRGNVVKYVCRAGKKVGADELQDLLKALDYLNWTIERVRRDRAEAAYKASDK